MSISSRINSSSLQSYSLKQDGSLLAELHQDSVTIRPTRISELHQDSVAVRPTRISELQGDCETGGGTRISEWSISGATSLCWLGNVLYVGSDVGTISCVDPLASAVSCSVTLHSAPVVSLQSFSSRESRSSTTKLDLLAVHSDNVLVYVDGESLCGDGAPRLIKWVLPYQEIMDVAVYDSPIDDGSDEESMVYHVIAVGKSPMIANLVSNDVVSQFSIVQTGLDVAKMLTKSIVSYGASFLFRNSGQFDRRNSKEGDRQGFDTKAPEQLRIKTRIDDPFRTIEKIQLCPSRSFAILSDTFGRILLFDVEQFIIVRMWKGYRGAQCAWLSDSRFGGFFLCIYIPRRGQLEIWRMPFGAKVDAISVDANANLMCTYDESKSIPYARCFLITQKLEEICEIKLSDSAAHSVQSDSRLYSTIITSANQNEIS